MRKDLITRDQVVRLLRYDEETGKLYWLVARGSTVKPGTEAGTETSYGCLQMSLLGLRLQVSHVIWFICFDRWPNPELLVDHIDRNSKNNRIKNLRQVTKEVNALHDIHKNSKQGVYETSAGRFCVVYESDGLSICHDSFATIAEAQKSFKRITHDHT